ncbi:MAG: hypothetical protein MJY56_07245 [Bacteroidales bacterium]|nr:hypothetical protein [Bacteroidales bacterium]
MKRIKFILISVLAGAFAVSCQDALTLTPETDLAPATFFSSAAELELWTNRYYALFPEADELAKVRPLPRVGPSHT